MTLYEQFKLGEIDLMEYHIKAEEILMEAIEETIKSNPGYTYNWVEKLLKETGDLKIITELKGSRQKVREALKNEKDKIDLENLNMVLLSATMEEEHFKELYDTLYKKTKNPLHKGYINVETSNGICSIIATSSEILKSKTTVGLVRENNEDFVVTIVSPTNEKIKLLVVCDGIGGYDSGEVASKFAAKSLVNWFVNFDFTDIDLEFIHNVIRKKIKEIHNVIKNLLVGAGTTLTAALVCENKTIIANIGDSRTYAIKDSKLIQVTEDDSTLWKKYYENDEDFHKDDLRFLVGNNCIEDCLGSLGTGNAKTYVIDNDNYEGLLLVSDGVTDIVSDEKMTLLYKETPKEDFIDQILFESCYGASESFYGEEDYFFQRTRPGKDNASAALYLKR